jgi:hypothetical protein
MCPMQLISMSVPNNDSSSDMLTGDISESFPLEFSTEVKLLGLSN